MTGKSKKGTSFHITEMRCNSVQQLIACHGCLFVAYLLLWPGCAISQKLLIATKEQIHEFLRFLPRILY